MRVITICGFMIFLFFMNPALHAWAGGKGEDEFHISWNFENTSSWIHPATWPGEVILNTSGNARSGKGCMELVANGKDNPAGRVFLKIPQYRIGIVPGRRFLFKAFVKGEGKFRFGIVRTSFKNGQRITGRETGESFSATPDYREYCYLIDLSDSADTLLAQPMILQETPGRLFVDDARMAEMPPEPLSLCPDIPHLIVPDRLKKIQVTFTAGETNRGIRLFQFINDLCIASVKKKSRRIVFTVETMNTESVMVRAASGGNVADVRINRIPAEDYERLDAVAAGIHLEKPCRILYLGDSITDFQRGCNYVDKLNYWLNLHNPGKASFRNAAVHGDFITRMLQRLEGINGKRKAFKQYRYDGLWDEKYDLVFLWVGHNDTVAHNTWDKEMKKPRILPNVQRDAYMKVIAEIRKHTDAQIILVSAASLNEALCRRNAEKMKRTDGLKYMFGRPELLEEWNRNLRQIAEEQKTGYLDVYQALKGHPDKAAFFSPEDGVHPVEKGHNFLAELFLVYLAERGVKL